MRASPPLTVPDSPPASGPAEQMPDGEDSSSGATDDDGGEAPVEEDAAVEEAVEEGQNPTPEAAEAEDPDQVTTTPPSIHLHHTDHLEDNNEALLQFLTMEIGMEAISQAKLRSYKNMQSAVKTLIRGGTISTRVRKQVEELRRKLAS
jgi:hypothetical protein